jgi:hypothetical protein
MNWLGETGVPGTVSGRSKGEQALNSGTKNEQVKQENRYYR